MEHRNHHTASTYCTCPFALSTAWSGTPQCAAPITLAVDGLPMRTSGAAYRKVPCALEAEEKQSVMVARPTSATFAAPPLVSRMLLVFTSLPTCTLVGQRAGGGTSEAACCLRRALIMCDVDDGRHRQQTDATAAKCMHNAWCTTNRCAAACCAEGA